MSENPKLSAKYIADHQANLHTADSFGRAFAEQVLQASKQQLADGAVAPNLELPAKITVSPVERFGCIRLCVNIGGVLVCYHVNT